MKNENNNKQKKAYQSRCIILKQQLKSYSAKLKNLRSQKENSKRNSIKLPNKRLQSQQIVSQNIYLPKFQYAPKGQNKRQLIRSVIDNHHMSYILPEYKSPIKKSNVEKHHNSLQMCKLYNKNFQLLRSQILENRSKNKIKINQILTSKNIAIRFKNIKFRKIDNCISQRTNANEKIKKCLKYGEMSLEEFLQQEDFSTNSQNTKLPLHCQKKETTSLNID